MEDKFMGNLMKDNKKVVFNKDLICKIGGSDLDRLVSENVYRLCLHESETDKVQEMLTICGKYVYIRPHYHPSKTETMIIIKGKTLVLIYDLDGNVTEYYIMSNENDEDVKIIRFKPNVPHNHIPLTDIAFFEYTPGPFDRENDSVFLECFPEDMSKEDVKKYVNNVMGLHGRL
jgi:cupin fold WbuC family metalloprotein